MKKPVLLLAIFFLGLGIYFSAKHFLKNSESNSFRNIEGILDSVPLPSEEDTIRSFSRLVDEGKVDGAISLFTKDLLGDESSKQAWGVHFNSFTQFQVKEIKKVTSLSGTPIYEVIFIVHSKPEAYNAPIPFYGWEDGENIRWIEVIKDTDGRFRINSIATSK